MNSLLGQTVGRTLNQQQFAVTYIKLTIVSDYTITIDIYKLLLVVGIVVGRTDESFYWIHDRVELEFKEQSSFGVSKAHEIISRLKVEVGVDVLSYYCLHNK